MAGGIERQVRFNMVTNPGEQVSQRHRWIFLVINSPREIERARQKIINGELAPVDDYQLIVWDNLIPGTKGIHYSVFAVSSEKGKLSSPEKIYRRANGRKAILYDRDLHDSLPEEWFNRHVLGLMF